MTLATAIATHRALYRQELAVRPTTRAVPSDTEAIPMNGSYVEVTDSGELGGMPFSIIMARLLGHPENYGQALPWMKALWLLKAECRKKHPYHRGATVPWWRGSLCWQLVTLTVIGKPKGDGPATIQEAAAILQYDNPEPLLRDAFDFIESTLDDFRKRAEKRAREDEGHGPGAVPVVTERPCYHEDCSGRPHFKAVPHPDHPEHWRECPNPVCRARRAA